MGGDDSNEYGGEDTNSVRLYLPGELFDNASKKLYA